MEVVMVGSFFLYTQKGGRICQNFELNIKICRQLILARNPVCRIFWEKGFYRIH